MERLTEILVNAIKEEIDNGEAAEKSEALLTLINEDPKMVWNIIYRFLEKSNDDSLEDGDKTFAQVFGCIMTVLVFERFGIDAEELFDSDADTLIENMDEKDFERIVNKILSD